MSSRGKKVSAFAVFRGRKTTSLSDVVSSTPKASKDKANERRAASASTTPVGTPSNSRETSISSINSKASNSSRFSISSKLSSAEKAEKKKQKAEMKRLKKILKSANKGGRASYLPDAALQSPLAALSNGNVMLKTLRPKGSMTNIRYQLPLKADPAIQMSKPPLPTASKDHQGSPMMITRSEHVVSNGTPPLPPKRPVSSSRDSTPPLPPRQIIRGSQNENRAKAGDDVPLLPPRQGSKRDGRVESKIPTPRAQRESSVGKEEQDGAPPRPAKRRRVSVGSSTPSPQKTPRNSVLGPDKNARERVEPVPIHPADRDNTLPYMHNSQDEAKRLFECLIHPVKPDKFFNELWERKPLLVKRHMPEYNDGWFSTAELDRIMREERIQFTENIDVVTYRDNKRETHNPVGRAFAPVVWDYYQNGCSVRMLNPQTYSEGVWKLLSILQEYFGCNVGANIYLTPPGTQGFAPHYDDIEAFILQLEGKKHWRLYSPRTESETLPRFSSNNFSADDIGEPILDVILEAGDLLYFPRGTIHQGRTLDDAHSLHITVSTCQQNTWGDFLQKLVPAALNVALDEDIEFRRALPRDYLNHMGIAFSDSESPERKSFLWKIEQLMLKLLAHAPVDIAADQMGKKFVHDSLPPLLTEEEKQCSIHGNGEHWDQKQMRIRGAVELEPDTMVKIIRKGLIRLVTEEDKVCIYHSLDNTRIYRDVDPQYIEVSAELAPGVEHLLAAYPSYVSVDSLPLNSVDNKMELAISLYERGLLMTSEPLLSDNSSDDESDLDE